MPGSRLVYLFIRYINNNYTKKEEEEFMNLLAQYENQEQVKKIIDFVIENTESEITMSDEETTSILHRILNTERGLVVPFKGKKNLLLKRVFAAAVLIIFFTGVTYWIFGNKENPRTKVCNKLKITRKILPGGERAVLTTSNGNTIILDSIESGTLLQKGAVTISKQGGILVYNVTEKKPGERVEYNTLSTPRGGQYQVWLPDGSKVWLNAASSLYFPTVFKGNERIVKLTGEAYFEVSKNKEKPFVVKVGEMQVKVLGTHFNINSYSDKSNVKTSLLEGRVKVSNGNALAILKPGEQALMNNIGDKMKISNFDKDEVIAWKNGLFQFKGADLKTIMQEIARWYNVDVVFSDKLSNQKFEGKISRKAQLSEVLRILELSNVKFNIVGNEILVL